MIASFSKGSNVTGMILYNENKVSKGHATLCFTNNILVENPTVYRETFTNMIAGTKMEAPTFHCSLSFSPEETLSNETIQDISKRYMAEMGYSNQPYVVYEHRDTAHQHVHILSVNVDENNKRIPEWGDRFKSQKITRDIEQEFGLKQVNSRKEKNSSETLDPKNFKTKVAKVAMMVKKDYQPETISDVNKIFASFNIQMVEVEQSNEKLPGFVFMDLNNEAQKPIKASHLYHTFNDEVLNKLYEKSAISKNKFDKAPMIARVNSVLKQNGLSEKSLKSKLHSKGIGVIFERYKDGSIYGISLIDQKSGLMFKGSELHRDFSFNKIKELIKAPITAEVADTFITKLEKVVLMVQKDYQPQNIKEVSKIFASFNIGLAEVAGKGEKLPGFIFRDLDNTEQKPIQAGQLAVPFSHEVLNRVYDKSATSKANFSKEGMISTVNEVLKEKGLNEHSFRKKLNSNGIEVIFERSKDKTITGISLIDQKSGLIFNSSELHRDFSTAKINELIKAKVPEEINLKELITKIINRFIAETRKEMTSGTGKKANRSEVLQGIPGAGYEKYIHASKEWLQLPKAQHSEAKTVIEAKIKWLTGSGVTMAMANEGMQLYVQQHLRENSQQYRHDPEQMLESIQKILANVPVVYSEKNMLADNLPLQRVNDRKDNFAWNMALDGVQTYTKEILKEKVVGLLHQIEHGDTLQELYAEKINNARAGGIEYITPEHLIFSEKGQAIIASLADHCNAYQIKEDKAPQIIDDLFVKTIQINEIKHSVKAVTESLSKNISDPNELSELYLSIHKEPFVFFSSEAIAKHSKSLEQLNLSHNAQGQLDSTEISTVNAQSELLLAKGSQFYLNQYFSGLYTPEVKLSEAFEKMSTESLKASPMGQQLTERLTSHLHADLKLDIDTVNQKIDAIIANSIENKKQGIPLIKIKENINEVFGELYAEISAEKNSSSISVKDFFAHPSAQKLNTAIHALTKDHPKQETIGSETEVYLLKKLFSEGAKGYFQPYNDNIASFKKSKHSQAETLLLDEAVRIYENRTVPVAKLSQIADNISPGIKAEVKEQIIEKAIEKQFKKILGSSFSTAFSKAYETALKVSGLPQASFIKEGGLMGITSSPLMAGYLLDFRAKTEKTGISGADISTLINGFTQQFISFKENQTPSRAEGVDISSLFTIKSRASRGLNDKKNKGLNH